MIFLLVVVYAKNRRKPHWLGAVFFPYTKETFSTASGLLPLTFTLYSSSQTSKEIERKKKKRLFAGTWLMGRRGVRLRYLALTTGNGPPTVFGPSTLLLFPPCQKEEIEGTNG